MDLKNLGRNLEVRKEGFFWRSPDKRNGESRAHLSARPPEHIRVTYVWYMAQWFQLSPIKHPTSCHATHSVCPPALFTPYCGFRKNRMLQTCVPSGSLNVVQSFSCEGEFSPSQIRLIVKKTKRVDCIMEI